MTFAAAHARQLRHAAAALSARSGRAKMLQAGNLADCEMRLLRSCGIDWRRSPDGGPPLRTGACVPGAHGDGVSGRGTVSETGSAVKGTPHKERHLFWRARIAGADDHGIRRRHSRSRERVGVSRVPLHPKHLAPEDGAGGVLREPL